MGIGKTAFGAFPDRTLRSLAVEAGEKCMADAGVSPSQIEAFYLGNFAGPSFVGQNHLAPYIAGSLGLTGVPCTRFEAACASGGSAFFHAVSSVAAGLNDIVLVAGVEKMTSQTTPKVTEILAGAGDMAGEGRAGATFPALFAMIAKRHMYQYGTTREQLAAVAVKNHANGAKNPLAHMRKVITMEQALAGKMISEPLTVFDCSLISDGAAAVVIVPLERASEFTDQPVRILGIAQTSDYVALDAKADITTFWAVREAAEKAYKMARVTARDIEFAEVHDCFTIAEIVATEDLGFIKKGEGGPYVLEGRTRLRAERPVNASGGLKAKGHPVGATGVGQICDVALQIRGEAGELQLDRHSIGVGAESGRLGRDRGRDRVWGPYEHGSDLHGNRGPRGAGGVRGGCAVSTGDRVARQRWPPDGADRGGARENRRQGRAGGNAQRRLEFFREAVKIFLYYVGKARDTHANAMAEEYIKRSGRFATCEMREIHPTRFDPWAKHPSAPQDSAGSGGQGARLEKAHRAVRPGSGIRHWRRGRIAAQSGSRKRTCWSRSRR